MVRSRALVAACGVPRRRAADVDALLGRRLTDVRLEAGGAPVTDGAVLSLVETRVGEPLVMADVRQTIDHLVTLGRFADIRVFGEPDGDGVRLRYGLVPLDRIVRVRFAGAAASTTTRVRAELNERLGAMPLASRRDEMAQSSRLATKRAAIRAPRSTSGSRRRAGEVGDSGRDILRPARLVGRAEDRRRRPAANLLARLDLVPGRPLDRETLDQRVRAAEDGLRDQRYYQAVVSATVNDVGPAEADITVRVSSAIAVQVEFAGDPLPASRAARWCRSSGCARWKRR